MPLGPNAIEKKGMIGKQMFNYSRKEKLNVSEFAFVTRRHRQFWNWKSLSPFRDLCCMTQDVSQQRV